jgi:hypothetical protein
VVACLPLDPRFACTNPAEDDGFLRVIKIRSISFGWGGKPVRPILKNPMSMKEIFCRQNSSEIPGRVYPASLLNVYVGERIKND